MRKNINYILILIFCSGCSTKDIYCELRLEHTNLSIERIHLVQPGSISSTKINLEPSRKDDQYVFYNYSGLLDGTNKGFLVIDFTGVPLINKRTEVYDLRRCELSLRKEWSNWVSPQFMEITSISPFVDWWILKHIKEAHQRKDTIDKISMLRFKMRHWDPYKKWP